MRFFFAGLRGKHQPIQRRDGLEQVRALKPRSIFLTYWDIWSGKSRLLVDTRAAFPDAIIVIDSGAHSFFGMSEVGSSTGKVNSLEKMNPEIYYRSYMEWLEKNQTLYDYFVELDVSEIFGLDFVLRWRNILASKDLWDRCIQAWHTDMDWDHWEAMVGSAMDGSRYVAIQGLRGNTDMIHYNRYIKYAYDNEVRVHGFAFTSLYTCEFPFASVDSTTWLCSAEYGTILTLEDLRVRQIHPRYDRKRFLNLDPKFAAHGQFTRDPKMLDGTLVRNIETMIELERRVTDVWEARGVNWEQIEDKYPSPRKELMSASSQQAKSA